MLEMVTNWPVVAIVTGLGEPKNVAVTSIKNTPVRDSIIHIEKKATAKEGTKSFPREVLLIEFCSNLSSLLSFFSHCRNLFGLQFLEV
jgi:hypothetical protein